MGDNVFLGDRDGVRTPMQWSLDRNGGFSRADPASLYLPPIMDPVYGFEAVNVEAQSRSPSSLLNWTKRLIAARRTRRAFGRGTLRFLYPGNRKVIAYLREWEGEIDPRASPISSRTAQAVELDLSDFRGRQRHRGAGPQRVPADRRAALSADPAGPQLFLVRAAATPPRTASRAQAAPPEFVTLVMPHGWGDLFTPAQSAAARTRRDPGLSAAAALVRRQGPADQRPSRAGAWRNRAPRRSEAAERGRTAI